MSGPGLIEVRKLAKCNRCGSEMVAWVKGKKSGRWYLAEALLNGNRIIAQVFKFHSCSNQENVNVDC
jgi:hypothetical protein